eukprot:m.1500055 g.1500055  ORF g.1500055 m.1500055 type:complete len:206 (-) comp25205_c0_seq34:1949-2566(-)
MRMCTATSPKFMPRCSTLRRSESHSLVPLLLCTAGVKCDGVMPNTNASLAQSTLAISSAFTLCYFVFGSRRVFCRHHRGVYSCLPSSPMFRRFHVAARCVHQALAFFEKELQGTISAQGAQSPDVAVIYNNMGRMHAEMGSHSMAIELFSMALDITSHPSVAGRNGVPHPAVLPLCAAIANEHTALGNPKAAADYHERARRLQGK